MDWLKLFALLVAVASIDIKAEGAKKKIRIHLPQKVKHIHHHKKIYITNHAASQYAPAFMPSAEGAVAVPTNMALPAVANILPLNSVELYEDGHHPRLSPAGSKIVPLYRARGYYGPHPVDSEDQEYDLLPPPEPTDNSYLPTAFADPSPAPHAYYPGKKIKILKGNEGRKKPARKPKPKPRAVAKVKPQPPSEEELPVTSYHEQFYSDLDGSGTIRKIRKPPRVEKIIDGDTEHIHTYSEEHIHKIVYDDGSSKLAAVEPLVGSMSALAASHPLIRVKNNPPLLALPPNALHGLAVAPGSMGTPSHLEYSGYNPREVTHDHIFHDHGEIPSDIDVTKEALPYPPRLTYNSQGVPIAGAGLKGVKQHRQKYLKRPGALTDYSYYENIYMPYSKYGNVPKSTNPTSYYGASTESNLENYKTIPSYKNRDKGNYKTRNVGPALYFGNGKQVSDYGLHQQASVPAPFAVSSAIVQDYNKQKNLAGHSSRLQGLNNYKNPLYNFKDTASGFVYDPYGSSSNLYTSEDKNDNSPFGYPGKNGKKKSISIQNINFGGKDLQTTVDHLSDSSGLLSLNDDSPSAFDSATSTPFTIRESSPAHSYYSAMANKALQQSDHVPESSNDNFQYVEAPTSTISATQVATTTASPHEEIYQTESTDPAPTEPTEQVKETKKKHRSKERRIKKAHKGIRQRYSVLDSPDKDHNVDDRPLAATLAVLSQTPKHSYKQVTEAGRSGISLKYGDRI